MQQVRNIYLYDIDYENAKNVASEWQVSVIDSLEKLNEIPFTIISICAPTPFHENIFEQILNKKKLPQVIWLEKPASGSSLIIEKMLYLAREKGVEVFVNYIRRFDPQITLIKNEIDENKFGKIISIKGAYGKGLINNGSHLLNIIQYFFGEVVGLKEISRVIDYNAEDPTVTAIGRLENDAVVYLEGINSNFFTIFELELIFEKARLVFYNSFFEYSVELVEADELIGGYKILSAKEIFKTDLMYNMKNVLDYIIGYLKKEKLRNISDLNETQKTITACEAVLTRKISRE
jgi:predicted dehydrogenase